MRLYCFLICLIFGTTPLLFGQTVNDYLKIYNSNPIIRTQNTKTLNRFDFVSFTPSKSGLRNKYIVGINDTDVFNTQYSFNNQFIKFDLIDSDTGMRLISQYEDSDTTINQGFMIPLQDQLCYISFTNEPILHSYQGFSIRTKGSIQKMNSISIIDPNYLNTLFTVFIKNGKAKYALKHLFDKGNYVRTLVVQSSLCDLVISGESNMKEILNLVKSEINSKPISTFSPQISNSYMGKFWLFEDKYLNHQFTVLE